MIEPWEAIHEDDGVIKISPGINVKSVRVWPLGVRRDCETPRFGAALLTGLGSEVGCWGNVTVPIGNAG